MRQKKYRAKPPGLALRIAQGSPARRAEIALLFLRSFLRKNRVERKAKTDFFSERKVAGKVRKLGKASRFWPKARMRPEAKKGAEKTTGEEVAFSCVDG